MVAPTTAPIITQNVPPDQPATAGAVVADLTIDASELAEDIFFTITDDPDAAFTVSGTTLTAEVDLTAPHAVTVVCENIDGNGPPTTQTLTFAASSGGETGDGDEYNPQFPPAGEEEWTRYIAQATHVLFPRAIQDADYVVGRVLPTDPIGSVYWNTELLGARPDAEIEELARSLAEPSPPVSQSAYFGQSGQPAPAIPSRPPIALYAPLNPPTE